MQKILLTLQRRRQHPSVFIAVLSLGFICGVLLALVPDALLLVTGGWAIGAVLFCVLCFWRRASWMLIVVLCAGMVLGLVRSLPDRQDMLLVQRYENRTVSVKGVVSDDTTVGKKNDTQVKLNLISINGKQISGTVWLSTFETVTIKRGYELNATGKLQQGFGNFSASIFRADITKVVDTHQDKAREARDVFSEAIGKYISEPESSLGIGFLVGQKSALPADFELALRVVALTHIVVASGYNLTILVRFTRRLFARISKYLAALSGGIMITGFIFVTGFSPSMTRAGLVAGLSLVAWYYGRSVHPLILLPFTAAISLLINPSYIWGDLGWYLSFAAFAGVMVFAPLLQHYFFGAEKPKTIRQIVGETISAQLFTLPIIAFSFGVVSLYALPANLLVLPFVPLAMVLVALAGSVTLLLPSIAWLVALAPQVLLSYMTQVVWFFSSAPNASVEISFGIWQVVLSYVVISGISIYLWRSTKHSFRGDNIVE